jgi:hypothetical protein
MNGTIVVTKEGHHYEAHAHGAIHIDELPRIIANNDVEAIGKVSRWLIRRNRNIDNATLSPEMKAAVLAIQDDCSSSL